MAALDTNVLVRYLVQDDPAQSAAAKRLIRTCVNDGAALHIPVSVSLELEWVLRSNYGFGKSEVINTLSALLSANELSFESETALEHALRLFAETGADYADCLHVALAAQAGAQPLWTFDRRAARVPGAQLLG